MIKIALSVGGGLGDVVGHIFGRRRASFWSRLPAFHRLNDCSIQIIVTSHNPASCSMLEKLDFVDHVTDLGFNGIDIDKIKQAVLPGYKYLMYDQAEEYLKDYVQERVDIPLLEQDIEIFNTITSRRYIFLYPFGGYGARIKAEQYIPLIERYISLGYNVVIGGATYIRDDNRSIEEKIDLTSINVSRLSMVYNLIGVDSCLSMKLASEATVYVGSIGSFLHAALLYKTKCIILTCYEIWPFWENMSGQDPTLWAYYEKYKKANFIRINNDEYLDGLWSLIVNLSSVEDSYRYLIWEDTLRPYVGY